MAIDNLDGIDPPPVDDPNYVAKINASLEAIDDHDHSSTKGLAVKRIDIEATDDSTITAAAGVISVKPGGITATEIAANAVGSSELADGAVDTGAIAAGAVTGVKLDVTAADASTLEVASGSMRIKDGGISSAKLASNLNIPGDAVQQNSKNLIASNTNATKGLVIVRGAFNGSGTLTLGEGFTSVKNSTGNYTVTFSTSFGDTPVVVGSCTGGAFTCVTSPVNGGSVVLLTKDTGGSAADAGVHFHAIGQRA